MHATPSLLGIPIEVRSMILYELALIPRPAPASPAVLLEQKRREIHKDEKIGEWQVANGSGDRHVLFEGAPVPNPLLPVLLTSRQLRDEARDMLRRRFTAEQPPPNYTLDVMYLKDCTLWPTWLSVPARASHVDTVTAQFRLFNCPGDKPMPYNQPRVGIYSTNLIWPFYHLLVGSIKMGPCGRPITMRRLVLDFLPSEEGILPLPQSQLGPGSTLPDPLKAWQFYGTCHWSCLPPPDDPELVGPVLVLNVIKSELEKYLKLTPDYFEYCKHLYEHVGEIQFRLAGTECATVGFVDELAGTQIWGPPGSYREYKWREDYLPWRLEVERKRRELGMPVKHRP